MMYKLYLWLVDMRDKNTTQKGMKPIGYIYQAMIMICGAISFKKNNSCDNNEE